MSCQVNWHARAVQVSAPFGGPPGPVHSLPLYEGTSVEGNYLAFSTSGVGSIPPTLLDSQAVQRRGPPLTFGFVPTAWVDLDHSAWPWLFVGTSCPSETQRAHAGCSHLSVPSPISALAPFGYSACAIPPPWRGSRAQSFLALWKVGNLMFPLRVMAHAGSHLSGSSPLSTMASPLGLLSPASVPPLMRAKVHSTMYYPSIDLSFDRFGPLSLALAPYWLLGGHCPTEI